MNWGIRIIILLGAFISMVLFMVSRAMKEEFHLVTENYYEREVKYQEEIDKINNARALTQPISISYQPAENMVCIAFPDTHKRHVEGKVYFFRPSDSSLDREFEADPDESGLQNINVKNFEIGLWQVKISWRYGQQEFQEEKNIIIQ